MIWINENLNILSDDEFLFLKNKCDNFILTETPKLFNDGLSKNYYHREIINFKNSPEILKIVDKIKTHIKNTTGETGIEMWNLAINKIFKGSNIDDEIHRDMCDLTFILYLNENFEGGEFEYIDDNKKNIKIKPKTNLSIISNNNLQHRVLPVTDGERFSLIIFFNIGKKIEKTLI